MKKIILILILILLIFFNPVTALYQNNPTYVESINCLYDFDGESIGCTKTTSGSVSIEYQSPYGYVLRVGNGYSDNSNGDAYFTLNSQVNGDFEVVILYNALSVKGQSEGRTDNIGIELGDYRLFFQWSNYVSNLYNGRFVLYQMSSGTTIKSVTGNVNMWTTYFSKNKFYKIVFGRTGKTYYMNLIDSATNEVLEEFSFTNDGIKPMLNKVYMSTWQGRAWIDSVKVRGENILRKDIIKAPAYIELKNGGTEDIVYPVSNYPLLVYNPNPFDLTEYQVKIIITGTDVGNQFFWIKEGAIRIFDQEGNELPYFVEKWDKDNKEAIIWTKIPLIPADGTVRLTLHSSIGYNDRSNGEAVFDFYDDFDGTTLDTGKWVNRRWLGTGSYYAKVNYGYVEIYSGSSTSSGIATIKGFQLPIIVEGSWMAVSGTEMWTALTHMSGGNDSDWLRTGYVLSGKYYYQKRVDWTITTYQTFSKASPKSFTRFTWIVKPDNAIYYEEGQQVNTVTTQDRYSTETLYLELFTWNEGIGRWDWIRVRKYADQEPTVTFVS